MNMNAFQTAAAQTLRTLPEPTELALDQAVWILPSEYGNDSTPLTLGMVLAVCSEDHYEVDCDGVETTVHAQRLRAA